MTTKRWNAAKQGKILAALFESNKADPRYTKATDIDPFKDMHDDFKDFTLQQFRNNYKTTATNWMAGKAVEGTRLKSLNRELHFVPSHHMLSHMAILTLILLPISSSRRQRAIARGRKYFRRNFGIQQQ